MQGCGWRGYFRGQLGYLIFNARGWADGMGSEKFTEGFVLA